MPASRAEWSGGQSLSALFLMAERPCRRRTVAFLHGAERHASGPSPGAGIGMLIAALVALVTLVFELFLAGRKPESIKGAQKIVA